jgi:hypothetical protein
MSNTMTEATRMAESGRVQDAVSKIIALRKLTQESGCITKNTQSAILRALTPDELTAVAEILANPSEAHSG